MLQEDRQAYTYRCTPYATTEYNGLEERSICRVCYGNPLQNNQRHTYESKIIRVCITCFLGGLLDPLGHGQIVWDRAIFDAFLPLANEESRSARIASPFLRQWGIKKWRRKLLGCFT